MRFKKEGAMIDPDLDELARSFPSSPAPEAKAGGPYARGALARRFEGFSDVTRRTSCPLHGEDRYIFERLYAVRLDRLRALLLLRALLGLLAHGLLGAGLSVTESPATYNLDSYRRLGAHRRDDITVRATSDQRRTTASEEIGALSGARTSRRSTLVERVEADLRPVS